METAFPSMSHIKKPHREGGRTRRLKKRHRTSHKANAALSPGEDKASWDQGPAPACEAKREWANAVNPKGNTELSACETASPPHRPAGLQGTGVRRSREDA